MSSWQIICMFTILTAFNLSFGQNTTQCSTVKKILKASTFGIGYGVTYGLLPIPMYFMAACAVWQKQVRCGRIDANPFDTFFILPWAMLFGALAGFTSGIHDGYSC